jgi:hypothetical protein
MSTPQSANPGFAFAQLARALTVTANHPDASARERALLKAQTWGRIFQDIIDGSLQVGSRQPTKAPTWATLEVAHGGFATGKLLAEGPLQTHEIDLLSQLPEMAAQTAPGQQRAALNAWYLSEQGLAKLREMLVSGCYRVNVPEEGALLMVAWLLDHGQPEQARALLDVIGPYFPRLRFYPQDVSHPMVSQSVVHLQNIGQTIVDLQKIRPNPLFETQKEAVTVWLPLYDRVFALFAETVRGELPSLRKGADNKPLHSETGKFLFDGGWPCQIYPEGWIVRAKQLLADYATLRKTHHRCHVHETKRGLGALLGYLRICVDSPTSLTGREVGMIRQILAGLVTKYGPPNDARWQTLRQTQTRGVAGPTKVDHAQALIAKLQTCPKDQGLSSLDAIVEEATPENLRLIVRRSVDAPVEQLVEMGIIPSAEVLAKVIPQLTSQVKAAAIADPLLRRLYAAIYAAFRQRRSLLLLNLQSQVKLEELPWIKAINVYRQDQDDTKEQSRLVLEQVVTLSLSAFPQQILPNKLLQEIRALADGAGWKLPIVDELAADIFMGEFSEKFLAAAKVAARMLAGSIYERYYLVNFGEVEKINDVSKSWFGTPTSTAFATLCFRLAGSSAMSRSYSVAANGKVIEQQQILTTHNLAVLFDALGLADSLGTRLEDLLVNCFRWICKEADKPSVGVPFKTQLQRAKNMAYAWRQMLFFLAMLPKESVSSQITRLGRLLSEQTPKAREFLAEKLEGLRQASVGEKNHEPFLGWRTKDK